MCPPHRKRLIGRKERAAAQAFFADLANALRRFSIFFETRSSLLRAVFEDVATFWMLAREIP